MVHSVVSGTWVEKVKTVSPQASNLKTGLQGVAAANDGKVVGHRITVGVEPEKVHGSGHSHVNHGQESRDTIKGHVVTKHIQAIKPEPPFVDHGRGEGVRVRDLRVVKARGKDRGTRGYLIGYRKVLMVIVVAEGQPLFSKIYIPPRDKCVLVVRPAGVVIVQPHQIGECRVR